MGPLSGQLGPLGRRRELSVIRDGLIAEYRFNDAAGQTLTDYAGSYHGTLGSTAGADANDPAWLTEGMRFTTDDAVQTPITGYQPGATGDISVVAVVKTLSAGTGMIIDTKSAGTNNAGWNLYFSSGIPAFRIANGTNQNSINITASVRNDGSWHCLTGVLDRAALRLRGYCDAEAERALVIFPTTAGWNITPTQPLGYIGAFNATGSACINGDIAALLVYNRALSADEVARNYRILKQLLAPRGIALP